jgi:hypothetical protein
MGNTGGYTSAICTPVPAMRWMFEFHCPHCAHALRVPEQYLGISGRCNQCRGEITPVAAPHAAGPTAPVPAPKSREWYESRQRHFEHCSAHYEAACRKFGQPEMQGAWKLLLDRARTARDVESQKALYHEAIEAGCPWPFPYERLARFLAKERAFRDAYALCSRYFDAEHWKTPQWARSSESLLELMRKLQKRMQDAPVASSGG